MITTVNEAKIASVFDNFNSVYLTENLAGVICGSVIYYNNFKGNARIGFSNRFQAIKGVERIIVNGNDDGNLWRFFR
jgi:hypothetical protein